MNYYENFLDADIERFFLYVNFSGPNRIGTPCWEWTGERNVAEGYGRFFMNDRSHRAHRVFFQLMKGPIPADKPLIMHLCDNPPCVNPAHLFAGTPDENSADMKAKGRSSRGKPYLAPGVADRVIAMLKAGHPQRAVMRETGVCARAVSRYSVQVKRAVQISPAATGKGGGNG